MLVAAALYKRIAFYHDRRLTNPQRHPSFRRFPVEGPAPLVSERT